MTPKGDTPQGRKFTPRHCRAGIPRSTHARSWDARDAQITPRGGPEPISCLLVMPFPLGFIFCKVKQAPSGQTSLVTGYRCLWRSVQPGVGLRDTGDGAGGGPGVPRKPIILPPSASTPWASPLCSQGHTPALDAAPRVTVQWGHGRCPGTWSHCDKLHWRTHRHDGVTLSPTGG